MSVSIAKSHWRHSPRLESKTTVPHLEYFTPNQRTIVQIPMECLPFSLGRANTADFMIPSGQISRNHAEIYQVGDQVRVRDFNSTNGTFRNGHRIQDAALYHGDILHLAHQEFRYLSEIEESDDPLEKTDLFLDLAKQPLSVLTQLPFLKELLEKDLVRTFFQPIVTLNPRQLLGYEALGRGSHGKLSTRPIDLFQLAERCQLAAELSRVFRAIAVVEARNLSECPELFLNMHPAELENPSEFLLSLEEIRNKVDTNQRLVLEIHEETLTDNSTLLLIRNEMKDLGVGLAYDDFGTGRSRIEELVEVPPDYIKLNRSLVRELHESSARQTVIQSIVAVAKELSITVLAEGIETEDEAETCHRLGCTLGQGYLLGHPQAAPALLNGSDEETWQVEVRKENPRS